MAESKCCWTCPEQWSDWSDWLAAGPPFGRCPHARNRWRLPVILVGMLFAGGRRTVTTWLRAAGISHDFQDYYYFLAALGRKIEPVASRLLALVIAGPPFGRCPPLPKRILVVIVRKLTMSKIPKCRNWGRFATKLQLAARLVEWIVPLLKKAGKTVWIVIDGGYTKRPFLQRALKIGATIVGRLRKDAALFDLPPVVKKDQRRRGRPRKYGKNKLSLARRAAHKRGWQTIDCNVYGETVTKTYKTFLATYRPVGGVIRVVLVKEDQGCYAFFCTNPDASVKEILEAFADRATIEQDFHDVKEVWGAGQQQVRNIWTNLAVYNLNLWMHTLVELWSWNRSHTQLCDRRDSPWDDPNRRPSHANRRKALRRQILRNELNRIGAVWMLPRKIKQLAQSLFALVG